MVLTVTIMASAILIPAGSFRRLYGILELYHNLHDPHKPMVKNQVLPAYGSAKFEKLSDSYK